MRLMDARARNSAVVPDSCVNGLPGFQSSIRRFELDGLLTTRGLPGEHTDPVQTSSSSIILVADDDAAVRQLLRVVLSRAGYQVLEAADGANAVQWLTERRRES